MKSIQEEDEQGDGDGASPPGGGGKVEPFYFDARRGVNAQAIDIGFMPNSIEMPTAAFPAVEFFCLVGLQRCRPRPAGKPRVFDYFTWSTPCGIVVVPAAANGCLGDPHSCRYRFNNIFRTGQKKHKAFTPAVTILTGEFS